MRFLLENERAYVGASTLCEKLSRLGISPALYELPSPYISKPEEVLYWTDSLLNEVKNIPICEEVQYIVKVCNALQKWALRGYIIHVV